MTNQKIPLVDLKAQYNAIRNEVDAAMADVLETTSFIQGPALKQFETAFAEFQQTKHAIGVASGTAAIQLALQVVGVGRGDEVITSPHTFIATAEPIEALGAVPVFVDIDPVTYNIDPDQIEAAITPRTKAIMPVHLYGQIAAMDRIMQIAETHGLYVIEDAAQAHGAEYQGQRAGYWGHAAAFSFYPGKNLGAYGDAGAICTNDDTIADRVARLRNHGRSAKYEHEIIGYGERMDTLQAAVLNAKLPYLDNWSEKRRDAADYYTTQFAGVSGIHTPTESPDSTGVYHIYCVRLDVNRDAVKEKLNAMGIGAGIHYPIPLHLQPALSHLNYQKGDFPETECAAYSILSLPIYPEITREQLDRVVDTLKQVVSEQG